MFERESLERLVHLFEAGCHGSTTVAELGPASRLGRDRHPWLTPERLDARARDPARRCRCSSVSRSTSFTRSARRTARSPRSIRKLRGVGLLTWIYALVQMIDLRFYNSRWAQRRRASTGIPDSLHGWLFGQMLAWFGILYYGLTEDLRWYVAGLVILGLSFLRVSDPQPQSRCDATERRRRPETTSATPEVVHRLHGQRLSVSQCSAEACSSSSIS